MKATIFRHSSIERAVGLHPAYDLEDWSTGHTDYCDPIEMELPEGYTEIRCVDGKKRFADPKGNVCELVSNQDHGFWIMPMTPDADFGLYIKIVGTIGAGIGVVYKAAVGSVDE